MSEAFKYGTEIRTQIPAILQHVGESFKCLYDLREFARDRAALEKEYAHKLESLAKRYSVKAEKGRQRSAQESKDIEEEELEWEDTETTTHLAWTQLLKETEEMARDRATLANSMQSLIVDGLKTVIAKKEEAKRKHANFFKKLKTERDQAYAEKDAAKKAYDESCIEEANIAQKTSKADGELSDKASKHREEAVEEKLINKNLYLLALAAANAHKVQYYDIDLPELANHLQDLDASRIRVFQRFLLTYANIEIKYAEKVQGRMGNINGAAGRLDSNIDADVFIRVCQEESNKRAPNALFLGPGQSVSHIPGAIFEFLPWSGGTAAAEVAVDRNAFLETDPTSSTFLSNALAKERYKVESVNNELNARTKEANDIRAVENMGDPDDNAERLLEVLQAISVLHTRQIKHNTEINVIVQAIGDDAGRARAHLFKPTSFTIPTSCDFCLEKIWGLGGKGFTCRECGYNCHAKCEMKVPLNCTRVKGRVMRRKANEVRASRSRSNSNASARTAESNLTPYLAASSPLVNSGVKNDSSAPAATPSAPPLRTAKVQYDFAATESDQLNMAEGEHVEIIEEDDGSGWVKARSIDGEGLIPANYIEFNSALHTSLSQHAPAPSVTYGENINSNTANDNAGISRQVRALYYYEAREEGELTIHENDIIQLHRESDDGWWEGELNGAVGVFPASYVASL